MSPTRLVERFYHEVWNRADEAVAHEILHPNFRFRASLGPEKQGPDGFIEYMRLIHTALRGYTCTIKEIVEEGDRAAARLRFAGQHNGRSSVSRPQAGRLPGPAPPSSPPMALESPPSGYSAMWTRLSNNSA